MIFEKIIIRYLNRRDYLTLKFESHLEKSVEFWMIYAAVFDPRMEHRTPMIDREFIFWRLYDSSRQGLSIFLFFVFWIHSAFPQEPPFQDDVLTFTQYSFAEGLPFNPGTAILQDRAGYMWFGSLQGLCRYNGYTFDFFGCEPQNPLSLSSPVVLSLFEDDQERLWIGTQNGLNCMDKWRERCTHYFHDPFVTQSLCHDTITCFAGGLDNTLWVGTPNGLNRIDLKTVTFKRYLHIPDSPNAPSCTYINALCADERGMVWAGSKKHLFRLDPRSEQFVEIPIGQDHFEDTCNINCIIKSRSGKLWISHEKMGTTCLDPDTLQISRHKRNFDNPYESHRFFYEDSSGILWITTDSGLLRFNPQTGAWARELYRKERPNSLSSKGVFSVGGERSGAVWVATDNKLNRYDPSRFPFRMMKHDPNNPNSMSANSVFSICEDSSGIIWIGVGDGGLNRYDPQTQTFKVYRNNPQDATSLSYDTVTALCPDPSGKIWVGTHLRGLCLFDPLAERFQRFPFNKDSRDPVDGTGLNNDIVRAILIANDGKILIGTENGGLNIYDPQTRRFTYFQSDPNREDTLCSNDVRTIYQDREGTIWVGNLDFGSAGGAGGFSRGGLSRFIPETQSFKQYRCSVSQIGRLRGNRVYDLLEDRQSRFWIATDLGLTEFDRKKETFYYYNPPRGFRGNDFRVLVESEDDSLWISTGYSGISRLNLQTKEIDNFDIIDGLEELGFHIGVGLQARDGTLYFGSEEGLAVLDRGRVRKNTYAPPLHIQRIQVLDEDIPLSQIGEEMSIRLPYWKNVLSFEFTALNFTRSLQNQYAYRLEGLDKDWVKSGDRRYARYSKVPPGDYMFRVKGANNAGVWNETGDSIQITIDPPFWMLWWFRLTVALLLLILGVGSVYLRVRRIREDNRRLEKEVRDRTSQIRADRDYLRHIIHTSPVVILGFQEDGCLTFINPAGENTFGVSGDALRGQKWWGIAARDDEQERIGIIHRRIVDDALRDQEIPMTLPSGKTRTVMWSFVNRYDENEARVEILAFANDITDRLENEILEISSREQRRIGREIHDSLCQTLTGITFMCASLVDQRDRMSPSHAETITLIKEYLQKVTAQSKQLARGLYLHELENNGLEIALKELTNTIQSLFNVQCEFQCFGELTVNDMELATHMYRIAQEALSNAVKHSMADHIILTVQCAPRQVSLTIHDNGMGFDMNEFTSRKGMGLGIMVNRARMINASLTVDSHPGKGTSISCVARTLS